MPFSLLPGRLKVGRFALNEVIVVQIHAGQPLDSSPCLWLLARGFRLSTTLEASTMKVT